MEYSRIQRILHWGISMMMVGQLISEEFMKRPKPGRIRTESQELFFEYHELAGLVLLILVGVRLSLLLGNAEEVRRLYPWLSGEGLGCIVEGLKGVPRWLVGKFPAPSADDAVAGTVHGLGLLLGLALGMTGTIMLFGMNPDGSMDAFVGAMKEAHEVLGSLLWIYVIGHVGMAILHQLFGHRSFQRIFFGTK